MEDEFFHSDGWNDRRTDRKTYRLTEGQRDMKKTVTFLNFAVESKKK